MKATLHTDGGARGNPGPAGIGYVLAAEGQEPVTHGAYIGETTNNQAEYQALVAGLTEATELGVTDLACFLDSELVVKQVRGEYRVKNQELRPLFDDVLTLARGFESVSFSHIPRKENAAADALVNEALDNHKERKNS